MPPDQEPSLESDGYKEYMSNKAAVQRQLVSMLESKSTPGRLTESAEALLLMGQMNPDKVKALLALVEALDTQTLLEIAPLLSGPDAKERIRFILALGKEGVIIRHLWVVIVGIIAAFGVYLTPFREIVSFLADRFGSHLPPTGH